MDLLITLAAFLFALSIIVFVHELGHLLMAKLFKVKVRVFSLGFGKRLWGFRRGETDYRVSLVPLGGYVRMSGEMPDEASGHEHDFLSKPRWQRILVYLAGPAMNVVLAVVLIAIVFMDGIPEQAMQEIPSVVGHVEEDSAAAEAGLKPGDRIVAVDANPVDRWKEVVFAFATSPQRPVAVSVERGQELLSMTVTPRLVPRYEYGEAGVFPEVPLRFSEIIAGSPADRAGFVSGDELRKVDGRPISDSQEFISYIEARAGRDVVIEILRRGEARSLTVMPEEIDGKGKIGVYLGFYRRLPFGEAVVASVSYNAEIVHKTAQLLGKLFTRQIAAKSALSGPIEIAAWSGRAARRGFKNLLYTMGFLSISIGIMNLLPIPVLDGGHIFILLIESAMRRDLSIRVKDRVTQLGFMMLMTLMAVVIFFDLAKNLPGLIPGGG